MSVSEVSFNWHCSDLYRYQFIKDSFTYCERQEWRTGWEEVKRERKCSNIWILNVTENVSRLQRRGEDLYKHVHLIGCVLRAVFKLSMVLFLSSSSSFSRARSVFLCSTDDSTTQRSEPKDAYETGKLSPRGEDLDLAKKEYYLLWHHCDSIKSTNCWKMKIETCDRQ